MRREDILKEKYGRDSGFTVPDNYFEELNTGIMGSLPAFLEAPRAADMSVWQRIKPYVYLAAMFAGIWLMMQMFHRIAMSDSLNLDNPPEAIASAMENVNEDIYPYYTIENDFELESAVCESYSSIDEFAADFGYELKQ